MKKQFSWIALFIAISLISCIFGCKEPEIETDTKAPANVTSLTVTATDGNAVLTWKNPSDADFDGVQVSMSPAEGTLKNAISLEKDVTSFEVIGLENGKEYTFTVKTFDKSLNYSEGVTAKATVIDTSDKTAPANVTKLSVQAENGTAILSWKNPADTDFAGVQISMSPAEGTLKNAVSLEKNVTSFDVFGLENGKEYTFAVKTFDKSLNYSEGVTAKATVVDTSDKIAPQDVTELTATTKDAGVLLTWTDATDEDIHGYEVTWNKSAASESNSMMVAPGANGCYISNLTNGTEYTFTVKSVDTSGNKSQGVTISITPSIIEKSALEITLVPNTTERTNKDVVITVNVTTDAASEIKKIAYTIGTESNIDTVLAGTDITGAKEITATENTTFTVAVLDSAGFKEMAFITLSNIDKTAPTQVANVMPDYSRSDNAIKLSWTNPTDKDFAGTEIVYGKTESEETTTLTFDKNTTSAIIENIADDDSEYTIAIKTKDDVGNLGEAKTVTVVAATGAKITSVNLDRTHLDSIMTNRDIEVTIRGSKFNVLSRLLVQVTGETPVTAIIDAANNTATAIITAPVPESPTNNGTTYTVKVIADDILSDTTASFVVSNPADVTSIALSETQITVGTQESVTTTITGTNFDIRGVTKVKLLDSNGDEVIASTVTIPLESNSSNTEFTANIQLPTEEGTYTVAVFFDDVKDTTTTTLKVIESVASSYAVGDIILTDGLKVSVNDIATYTIDENNKPIGVVAMISYVNGVPTPKVIGLQQSARTLQWVKKDTTGYDTMLTNIVCKPSKTGSGAALTATFTGDTEGSDNWAEIRAVDRPGTAVAYYNYPAFYFANTYGTSAGLRDTDYEEGWYVPSIAELCEVYKNKEVIQTSLTKASGFEFCGDWYWSSSQRASRNMYACRVDFSDGYVGYASKDGSNYVFVLHDLVPKISTVVLDKTHFDTIMTNRDIDVSISGCRFDYFSSLLVQVTDGTTSQTPVTAIIDTANNTATATITAPVPESPTNNGITYTVKVITDGILSETTATFVVSNPADVTSITLAQIPLGRGESASATITGTNFDIRGVTKVKLLDSNGDEYTESTVTVPIANNTSNTEFTANIPLPAEVGTYTVAVFFDDVKDATTTTLEMQPGGTYKVGDIILTDGSKVYVENIATYTIDENNKPIGVVAMITDINGVPTPKVIGLQKPANELVWAPENTIGYKTNFTNIVCTPSQNDIGAALTATFTGDTEGSDNWAEICAVDPTGTANAAKNYPIFNFANTYGRTAGLTGTDYEEGWYVPSIAELCEVYKNKEVIQTSLTKASGFEFCGDWYWSSSQSASHDFDVSQVDFSNGYVFEYCLKYGSNNVFILRALTAK